MRKEIRLIQLRLAPGPGFGKEADQQRFTCNLFESGVSFSVLPWGISRGQPVCTSVMRGHRDAPYKLPGRVSTSIREVGAKIRRKKKCNAKEYG